MALGLRLVAAALCFVAQLAVCEWATARWSLAPEVGRKIAHVSGGLMVAALPLVLPFPAIVVLSAAFIPFMIVTRRLGYLPVIHGAERATYGEVYFPAGVALVALLVPHTVPYVFGILVMAVADAAAGIAGERFGRRHYRSLMGRKSYLGSTVFLITTLLIGVVVALASGDLSVGTMPALLLVAVGTTVEEALVGGGADNLVLPTTAAALLYWAV